MAATKYTQSTMLDNESILYVARIHRFTLLAGALIIMIGIVLVFPPTFGSGGEEEQSSGPLWWDWLVSYVKWAKYHYHQF